MAINSEPFDLAVTQALVKSLSGNKLVQALADPKLIGGPEYDLPDGWTLMSKEPTLLRYRDGKMLAASVVPGMNRAHIEQFEFAEGAQWTKEQIMAMCGAVGSSEAPPDPWRGISGPPGPLTPYGRRIASMQADLGAHFGTSGMHIGSIEQNGTSAPHNTRLTRPFSETVAARCALDPEFRAALEEDEAEPNDPAAWAKPGTPVMQKLIEEIDQWSAVVRDRDTRIASDEREILVLRAERDAWKYLYETVKPDSDARMLKADETGNLDYHGPVKDGKAVPDPTHERFHGSVGDVIAGNVMRPARDQMERALADARTKDGKTPPPFPSAHAVPDHRRIGS